VRFTR